MKKRVKTNSPRETKKLGEETARRVLKKGPGRRARVFALCGELGAGKTTFARGFARGLGVEDVKSPTYVIMKKHRIPGSSFKFLYHIDCYRLQEGEDLLRLGLGDITDEPSNVVLIEWAERVKDALPGDAFFIDFLHTGKGKRKIRTPEL